MRQNISAAHEREKARWGLAIADILTTTLDAQLLDSTHNYVLLLVRAKVNTSSLLGSVLFSAER
jgi:hypothetical protein